MLINIIFFVTIIPTTFLTMLWLINGFNPYSPGFSIYFNNKLWKSNEV